MSVVTAELTRAGRAPASDVPGPIGLVEVILKNPPQLDGWLNDPEKQAELIPNLLTIALFGFTVFGVAATVVLNASTVWPSWVPSGRWPGAQAVGLALAYDFGLVGALGVCLPSFFFFGLLSGLKISWLQATAHAVRCQAVTAVMLVGILPIYVAVALGITIFEAADAWVRLVIDVGLALPFLAGLWGVRSLYQGFARLGVETPEGWRARRHLFLQRLTLAWSLLYSAVTPVMIYALWVKLAG